jgi:spore coat protein U-like protein
MATATGLGLAEVGAELNLDAPTTTVAGTYVATLTVTVI